MFLATALLLATAAPLITPYRAARSQHGTFGWLWSSVGGFKWFSCTSPRCCFSLFNISLPYCLTSFRLAINWFISSFSSSFLATACGSSFPTHKGHFPPNMFLATALLLATAAPLITPYRAARSQHGTFGWLWSSVGGFKWFSCTSPRCCFSLFNISFPYCLTSFRLAINSFISSFSSSFLATACGSSFPTHKGHLLPIMFLATALLFATAAPLISPYRAARSQHGTFGWLWSSVGGFKWFSCTSPRCCISLFNISLPYCLTSFRLAIDWFISSFSSSFLATACGSSFPTHKWHLPPISAHHVLGHRSLPRHSRATDFPLPSCTFSARHLWVTVIFGRGFQVVFCTSPRCCFRLFNISLPYCFTSFRLAINWFISSFSPSFLATACGSSFPTHKGHLLPIMLGPRHVFDPATMKTTLGELGASFHKSPAAAGRVCDPSQQM